MAGAVPGPEVPGLGQPAPPRGGLLVAHATAGLRPALRWASGKRAIVHRSRAARTRRYGRSPSGQIVAPRAGGKPLNWCKSHHHPWSASSLDRLASCAEGSALVSLAMASATDCLVAGRVGPVER